MCDHMFYICKVFIKQQRLRVSTRCPCIDSYRRNLGDRKDIHIKSGMTRDRTQKWESNIVVQIGSCGSNCCLPRPFPLPISLEYKKNGSRHAGKLYIIKGESETNCSYKLCRFVARAKYFGLNIYRTNRQAEEQMGLGDGWYGVEWQGSQQSDRSAAQDFKCRFDSQVDVHHTMHGRHQFQRPRLERNVGRRFLHLFYRRTFD